MIWKLMFKSLYNRKVSTVLCTLSIALSLCLFLGVEKMRKGTVDGFTNTISNADLIVGARGGPLQLLLYTIFHLGQPTNNIRFDSYREIADIDVVDWVIPISLGDSYRGHRVVATDDNFYQHYQFHGDRKVELVEGQWMKGVYDVVLGSRVAKKLKHQVGDKLILTHGVSDQSIMDHTDSPFRVVGIMKATSTPMDQSVFISLYGMEAMHMGWLGGVPDYNNKVDYSSIKKDDIKIEQITAFIVRTKNRIALLGLQRYIQQFEKEPLMAIIPALTLGELWKIMSYLEKVLLVVSSCVLLVGLLGLIIALYTSLNERRREMAIFRSVGASLWQILMLLVGESMLLTVAGIIGGQVLLFLVIVLARPLIEGQFSIIIPHSMPNTQELTVIAIFLFLGTLSGLAPAIKAYRNSLADGLTIRT